MVRIIEHKPAPEAQNLIDNLRQGTPMTGFVVMGIINELERINALERELEVKNKDFTQLFITYSAAIEAEKANGAPFMTEEFKRLKDAVRLMCETREAYRNYRGYPNDDTHYKLWIEHLKARKAVEELL